METENKKLTEQRKNEIQKQGYMTLFQESYKLRAIIEVELKKDHPEIIELLDELLHIQYIAGMKVEKGERETVIIPALNLKQ